MRRNRSLILSLVVLVSAFVIMLIHRYVYSFSDWVVRVDGVILLLCVAVVTYDIFKSRKTT